MQRTRGCAELTCVDSPQTLDQGFQHPVIAGVTPRPPPTLRLRRIRPSVHITLSYEHLPKRTLACHYYCPLLLWSALADPKMTAPSEGCV